MTVNHGITAALLLTSSLAQATPITWELLNGSMVSMGTFLLDIDNVSTSNASLTGDFGLYTISSRTYLDSPQSLGPFTVNNYMNFFSAETGNVYRTDYGSGEYNEIRINEIAMEIGTVLDALLVPDGTLYEVYINEIYNFDETNAHCAAYEEIIDPETGEYTYTDTCLYSDISTDYNRDSGYWYSGFLKSAPVTVEVPVPATAWLLLLSLLGLRTSLAKGTCAAKLRDFRLSKTKASQ